VDSNLVPPFWCEGQDPELHRAVTDLTL